MSDPRAGRCGRCRPGHGPCPTADGQGVRPGRPHDGRVDRHRARSGLPGCGCPTCQRTLVFRPGRLRHVADPRRTSDGHPGPTHCADRCPARHDDGRHGASHLGGSPHAGSNHRECVLPGLHGDRHRPSDARCAQDGDRPSCSVRRAPGGHSSRRGSRDARPRSIGAQCPRRLGSGWGVAHGQTRRRGLGALACPRPRLPHGLDRCCTGCPSPWPPRGLNPNRSHADPNRHAGNRAPHAEPSHRGSGQHRPRGHAMCRVRRSADRRNDPPGRLGGGRVDRLALGRGLASPSDPMNCP